LRAGDAAAGHQQIERALRADQFRQQAGGGKRERASFISGWPRLASEQRT
jgi:hypothetical protein